MAASDLSTSIAAIHNPAERAASLRLVPTRGLSAPSVTSRYGKYLPSARSSNRSKNFGRNRPTAAKTIQATHASHQHAHFGTKSINPIHPADHGFVLTITEHGYEIERLDMQTYPTSPYRWSKFSVLGRCTPQLLSSFINVDYELSKAPPKLNQRTKPNSPCYHKPKFRTPIKCASSYSP